MEPVKKKLTNQTSIHLNLPVELLITRSETVSVLSIL